MEELEDELEVEEHVELPEAEWLHESDTEPVLVFSVSAGVGVVGPATAEWAWCPKLQHFTGFEHAPQPVSRWGRQCQTGNISSCLWWARQQCSNVKPLRRLPVLRSEQPTQNGLKCAAQA